MYCIYNVKEPDVPYDFDDGPAIFDTAEKANKMCKMMNVVIHDKNFAVKEMTK